MAQMASDISALGDTYCTCEINGGTTSVKPSQMTATSIMHPTTTTTSKARTTSTTTPTTSTTSTTTPTTTSTTAPTTTSTTTPTTTSTTTPTTSTTTPTTSTTTPTTSTTSTTKPTSSSTTQTSTTVMIPNTSVCNATTNITDSNGLITKKVCMISTGYAHAAAVAFCRSNGMQGLYAIVDVNHFNQLANFLTQKMMAYFGGINGCTLVIDGEQAANGTWFNYNPSASLLYSGAIPQTGSGGFILIAGTLGGFVTMAVSADTGSWVLCEYDVV